MDGWALPVAVNTLLPVYILTGRLGRWPSPGRDDPGRDPAGPGLAVAEIRVCQRCKGGSALRRAATPRAYGAAAGEKTSNKLDTVLVRYGGRVKRIVACSARSLQQQTVQNQHIFW